MTYPDQNYLDIISKRMEQVFLVIDDKVFGKIKSKNILNKIRYAQIYSITNTTKEDVLKKYKVDEGVHILDIKTSQWADKNPDKIRRGFKTIIGKVVDEEGKPLAGANIMIKGTRTGTATDFNGEYRLMGVDKNDHLIFSTKEGEGTLELPVGSHSFSNAIVQFPTVTLGSDTANSVEVYQGNVVESRPRFPGCENLNGSTNEKTQCAEKKFLEYLYENIHYPAIARKNNIQGQVVATFTVKKDGAIDYVHIIRDLGAGLGDEVERLLAGMNNKGKWTPAMKDGKPVNFTMTLPVIFKLKGEDIKAEIEKSNLDRAVNPLSEIVVVALSEAASKSKKTEQNAKQNNAKNPLDEVVVVGYGETTKIKNEVEVEEKVSSFAPKTGASADKKVENVKTDNPLSEKVVIGHPEKSSKLKIRGIEDVDYLLVLDGSIMNHAKDQEILKQIDPSSIESISILKEKNAIQRYGEQGKNGVIEITTKMSVKMEKNMRLNLANFNLFPNPASNEFRVNFQGPPGDYKLEVTDIKGATLARKEVYNHDQSKVTMDISNLNTGLYYLRILSDQKVATKTFVKE